MPVLEDLLTRKASVRPNSYNPETREFRAVISTGAPVRRRDAKGEYVERLDLDSINPQSLIGKAVILEHRHGDPDAHVGSIVGAAVEGSALVATIRMTSADSAASARQKVADGTYNSVSLGYTATKWAENKDAKGARTRTAVDWKIHEVSLTAIPADEGAIIRSKAMKPKKKVKEEIIEDSLDDSIIEDAPDDRIKVRGQIRVLVRTAKLPADFADNLIDADASIEEAREAINEKLTRRSQLANIRIQQSAPSGDDPAVIVTRATDALAARIMGTAPTDESRPYVNNRLVDHARIFLDMRGEATRGMRDEEILTRAAQHTLSDFPNLLTGTGQRVLLAGYQSAPNPLKSLARKGNRTDFRAGTSLQLGEVSKLEKVSESGEVKSKTRGEAKESYGLDTYGGIFSLSRKAIINDDLGAFRDWGTAAGKAASETEAALLLALLTESAGSGPVMHDTVRLFHASHGNLAGSGDSPLGAGSDLAPISDARLAMRTQKGLDGVTPINATPKYILVPASLETEVDQALALIFATAASETNPFSGKLTPLVEARLTGNGWYIFADPAVLPVLEYSYLSGAEGPQLASREGWDVLGQEFRVILDFGCGAVDWRGAYRNPGAA